MAKKLYESLCNTYEKVGLRIQIIVSIVISLGQEVKKSVEKRYEKADDALYEAKTDQ